MKYGSEEHYVKPHNSNNESCNIDSLKIHLTLVLINIVNPVRHIVGSYSSFQIEIVSIYSESDANISAKLPDCRPTFHSSLLRKKELTMVAGATRS